VKEAIQQVMAQPELPPGVDAVLVDDLPDLPGVYTIWGEDEQALYVGRASNVRGKVVSQLAQDGKYGKEPAIQRPVGASAVRKPLANWARPCWSSSYCVN
jgi:DNA polymerase-3 subunit epsilon